MDVTDTQTAIQQRIQPSVTNLAKGTNQTVVK